MTKFQKELLKEVLKEKITCSLLELDFDEEETVYKKCLNLYKTCQSFPDMKIHLKADYDFCETKVRTHERQKAINDFLKS